MASVHLTGPRVAVAAKPVGGLRLPTPSIAVPTGRRRARGLVVRAATVVSPKVGAQVVYSKYAGTELEFNDADHLILKEDDIIGILDSDDVKDLKPLNDRIVIKVAEAEQQTAGGLLLTQANKEKPSVGTVIAVGPGPLGEDGSRKPLSITPGSNVMYTKYAGSEFKGAEGDYIVLRASDVMALLS
nr:unnamed protein product [Digitaria exilis]